MTQDGATYPFASISICPNASWRLSAGHASSSVPVGDVSQGKMVSLTSYFEMFNQILTPRQLEAAAG
jgi:hypothetical protein